MIPNGLLIPIATKDGGFVNGRPSPSVQVKGEAVQCNYRSNVSDKITYFDGNEYKVARFIVIVGGVNFTADTVELEDKGGEKLGVYQVRNLERLHSVNRTKLTL